MNDCGYRFRCVKIILAVAQLSNTSMQIACMCIVTCIVHASISGLSLLSRSSSPRRVCDATTDSLYTCGSTSFSVHGLSYRHVYGRIIAYQNGYPIAFNFQRYNSIDQAYVFGVSLTSGRSPRRHIWTFAGAADEASNNPNYKCPCINRYMSTSTISIPSFIGNDYFCDTSLSRSYSTYTKGFYSNDPLWDGQGCGTDSTCCSVSNSCNNSPPWFIKHLSSSTTKWGCVNHILMGLHQLK